MSHDKQSDRSFVFLHVSCISRQLRMFVASNVTGASKQIWNTGSSRKRIPKVTSMTKALATVYKNLVYNTASMSASFYTVEKLTKFEDFYVINNFWYLMN